MLIPVFASHISRDQEVAVDEFTHAYGAAPQILIHAPYRICPLGAHVGHQFGRVAAGAIDHGITLAITPWDKPHIQLRSLQYESEVKLLLDTQLSTGTDADRSGWDKHARGAIYALAECAGLDLRRGYQGMILGARKEAGLSSSAAFGVAYLKALQVCNELQLDDAALVRADGDIEQGFLSIKNGSLDPAAVVLSRRDHLTMIDTRTCSAEHVPGGGHFKFLAVHSGLSEALTPENFNRRVDESRSAARAIARLTGYGGSLDDLRLGDLSADAFTQVEDKLSSVERLRAQHFYSETQRVEDAREYWMQGDAEGLGQLMIASAQSSIDNYECGRNEVRDLVALLNNTAGVLGARFCGPGFRRCSLALVEPDGVDAVVEYVSQFYAKLHPELARRSWILDCAIQDGARIL